MKVIEQLVDHLFRFFLLDDLDIASLRDNGFLPPIENLEYETYYDTGYGADYCDQPRDDDPEGLLLEIEEQRIQKDLSRKGSLPPSSSKGARRKSRQMKNRRSSAKQQRDSRRVQQANDEIIRISAHSADAAVVALIASLSHYNPYYASAADRLLVLIMRRKPRLSRSIIANLGSANKKSRDKICIALRECFRDYDHKEQQAITLTLLETGQPAVVILESWLSDQSVNQSLLRSLIAVGQSHADPDCKAIAARLMERIAWHSIF